MARHVLIADDEANIRFLLSELMRREGYEPVEVSDGQAAIDKIAERRYDIAILDIRMPRKDGLSALQEIRAIRPDQLVLMITAHGTHEAAMQAIDSGAYDYLTKPFDINEVRVVVRRAMERVRLTDMIRAMKEESHVRSSFSNIIGQSKPMQEVFSLIERVIDNDISVLIMGESGTGKEMIAAAIHHNSHRSEGPFIRVNTVAIPDTLLESEMFGHERGSFTGAVSQKIGKVEAANGGTLFLDEIGDMPLALQGKLLRVLQEREIERVGSTKTIPVDLRLVCATNCDLAKAVEEGRFREDLFYRINVMPIFLPPLRDRREDIGPLIDHFIEVHNRKLGKNIRGFSQGALQKFLDYPWPGNVRELENLVQRTMLLARGETVTLDDLPPVLQDAPVRAGKREPQIDFDTLPGNPLAQLDLARLLDPDDFATPLAERLSLMSDHVEKHLIRAALEKTGGHRQESADLLGISRKSLHNKMVRYGMFDE